MNDLVKFWTDKSNIDFASKAYIAKKDMEALEGHTIQCDGFSRYIEFLKKDLKSAEKMFHTGLIPSPFIGDLENADIYILSLNPGFLPLNYYEEDIPKLKEVFIKNLQQKNKVNPNFFFDPQFLWTGGAQYWTRKFDAIIQSLLKDGTYKNYYDALINLSKRIAFLELNPYHSKTYNLSEKREELLESKKTMLEFVHNTLVPRAEQNKALIIVGRSTKKWDLSKYNNKNIIVYGKNQTQSFSLKEQSPGGKRIIAWIKSKEEDSK